MNPNTLYVGIDIAKHKHDIAVMNKDKKLLSKVFVITENRSGYEQLCAKLAALEARHNAQSLRIGMEATGDYWKNLYHFLNNQSPNYLLTVINPIQTKAFGKTELRRAKTDPVNAKDIALFMIEKSPLPSVNRLPLSESLKDLDTQISIQRKQRTMMINKLRIELAKVAPEIEAAIPDLNAKRILTLLEHFPTAELIQNASIEQLRSLRYGKRQWRLPYSVLTKIKTLAENSIAHKKGEGSGWVVQALVRTICASQKEEELLKEQIDRLYRNINPQGSLLSSVPGISKQTAVILETYIGDVKRFSNRRQFVAYFGLNPTVSQSGKSIKKASRLEKKGSPRVRQILFLAVMNMIVHKKNPIYEQYQRMLKAGKPKLVAICAGMRKLLLVIFALLTKKQKFDPEFQAKKRAQNKK